MIAQAFLLSSLIATTPNFVVRPGDGGVARIAMPDAPGASIYDLSGRRINTSLGVGANGDLLWTGIDDRGGTVSTPFVTAPAATWLAMRGPPVRAIQELSGHRDVTTTQRYLHLSPRAVEHAIHLLEEPIPYESADT